MATDATTASSSVEFEYFSRERRMNHPSPDQLVNLMMDGLAAFDDLVWGFVSSDLRKRGRIIESEVALYIWHYNPEHPFDADQIFPPEAA